MLHRVSTANSLSADDVRAALAVFANPDYSVTLAKYYEFIKGGDPSTTFELAELLLTDREDLMHKAVGWMLREVGGRVSREALTAFLDVHAPAMPGTMLSYATEHFDPKDRAYYRALR